MELIKIRTLQLSEKEWNTLLGILAYIGDKVQYDKTATQHDTIKQSAYYMHSEMVHMDGET